MDYQGMTNDEFLDYANSIVEVSSSGQALAILPEFIRRYEELINQLEAEKP